MRWRVRVRYPTDTTDAEWRILKEFIPDALHVPNLMQPKYARRDVVDAIFYRERTGCQWRNLPHDFPPWKQVFEYYRKWRDDGTVDQIHDALRARVRQSTPHADGTARSAASPSACILDSQSSKTSEEGEEARGYDAGKKVKGRKRHLVVDALGLLLVLRVTTASVQDRDAALPMFQQAKKEFPSLQVAFADGAYRGEIKKLVEKKTRLRMQISLRSDLKKRALTPFRSGGSSNGPLVG